jgi:integral membrane protein (TIGR01906 family)
MLVVAAIALTVTPIFVVNSFRLLATDTFVRHEIDRGGFPPDRYGLTTPQRQGLALIGLHSILPGGDGIALLERATLPGGSAAFDTRELRHMRDVRSLLGAAFTAQLVALIAILALAIGLHRSRRWRSVVPWGLLLGSLLTIGIAVLAVPVILLGFDGFFLRFHEVFFNGDTWRFSETDTLLRIYPETFWQDTAKLAAAIVVAQAIVVGLAAGWWIRRIRPVSPISPVSPTPQSAS